MNKLLILSFGFLLGQFQLNGQICSGESAAEKLTLNLVGLKANGDIGELGNSSAKVCFPTANQLDVVGDKVSNLQITTSNGSWCSEANIRFGNINGGAGGWQFDPLFFPDNIGPCGTIDNPLDKYKTSGTPIFKTDIQGCIYYQVFDQLNDAGTAQDFIFDTGSINFYGCPLGQVLIPSIQIVQFQDTVCVNDSFNVAATAPMASNISWYLDQVSETPIAMGFGPLDLFIPTAGNHTIIAVANYANASDTTTIDVQVNGLPIVQLTRSVNQNIASLTGTVIADATDWYWDFGDGSPIDTNLVAIHQYKTNGSFTAKFTAINSCGATTQEIVVLISVSAPSAAISLSADTICTNIPIEILGLTPPSVLIDHWDWTFGNDASLSAAINNGPHQISWSTPGIKTIKLTVSNQGGSNTIETVVVVMDRPISTFIANPQNLTVSFQNMSLGGVSYLWNFGDGNTSTEFEPTHTYAVAGTYPVTLTVSNACGPTTSAITNVTVMTVSTDNPSWVQSASLYPNPVSHELFLNLNTTLPSEAVQVEVWSSDGRLVETTLWQIVSGTQVHKLSVEHLSLGFYSLILHSGQGSLVVKFIKG